MADPQIKARIGADSAPLKRELTGAQAALAQFAENTERKFNRSGGKAFGGWFRGLGALTVVLGGVTIAVNAITSAVQGFMNRMADVHKGMQRFGQSAQAVQTIGFLAKYAGGTFDEVATSLTKVSVDAQLAAEGNKELAAQLSAAGIEAKSFMSLDMEGELLALAAAYDATNGDLSKQAGLYRLLGSNADKVWPIISQGAANLQKSLSGVHTQGENVVSGMAKLKKLIEDIKPAVDTGIGHLVTGLEKAWDVAGRLNNELGKKGIAGNLADIVSKGPVEGAIKAPGLLDSLGKAIRSKIFGDITKPAVDQAGKALGSAVNKPEPAKPTPAEVAAAAAAGAGQPPKSDGSKSSASGKRGENPAVKFFEKQKELAEDLINLSEKEKKHRRDQLSDVNKLLDIESEQAELRKKLSQTQNPIEQVELNSKILDLDQERLSVANKIAKAKEDAANAQTRDREEAEKETAAKQKALQDTGRETATESANQGAMTTGERSRHRRQMRSAARKEALARRRSGLDENGNVVDWEKNVKERERLGMPVAPEMQAEADAQKAKRAEDLRKNPLGAAGATSEKDWRDKFSQKKKPAEANSFDLLGEEFSGLPAEPPGTTGKGASEPPGANGSAPKSDPAASMGKELADMKTELSNIYQVLNDRLPSVTI